MIYFDNASTTWPKPDKVYKETDSFFKTGAVNAGRGQYKTASKAQSLIKETRESVKELLRCNANYETVFSSSATEAINTVLQGIDYSGVKNIYITHFEHNAVTRTLTHLQKSHSFAIMCLPMVEDNLEYDLLETAKQFEEHSPDLLLMTHASNVCGLITPIKEICNLARPYNAISIVDMAQTAGLLDTDLTALGVSAAVFAGHKTLYGPLGAAGFVIKKDLRLKPLIYGGTGLDSASILMPDSLPERYEAGSRNTQAIVGLYHALEWIKQIGIKEIRRKEQNLKQELVSLLSEYKNLRIVGANSGIGIVSCVFEGYAPDEIGRVLDDKFDIAVRTGLHCSPGAHRLLGTAPAGTVRFSLGHFNNQSDFEILREALKYILENG